MKVIPRFYAYLEVTKPRESVLLAFIGVSAAVIAAGGMIPAGRFSFIAGAILIASAGANGLTNYLDRDIDARMSRTQDRVLASRRIDPAHKVLPLLLGLVIIGLVLAWQLHPFALIADAVGTISAVAWRKRWTCVFPQGMIASCAPVLMGWFAVSTVFSWPMLWLCILISIWLPIHLWSVMVTHREDYIGAGITFFPMSRPAANVVRLLVALSLALFGGSLGLYFIADFHWLYLVIANLLGGALIFTSLRLLFGGTRRVSWRLYRLSAFPYLGLLFLAMMLDIVLL